MAEKKIDIGVELSDRASAGLKSLAKNASESLKQILDYQRVSRESGGGEKGGGFEGLSERFGRGSTLFESAHTFGGAGPVIGITLAARELGEFAEKLQGVQKMMADGSSGSQIAAGIAKSIPVVGDVASSLESVLGLVTGITAATERTLDAAKAQDEFTRNHIRNVLDLKSAYEDVSERIHKMNEETARIGLTGPQAEFAKLSQDIADQQKKITGVATGHDPYDLQKRIADRKSAIQDQIEQQREEQKSARESAQSEFAQYELYKKAPIPGHQVFANLHLQNALSAAHDFKAAEQNMKRLRQDAADAESDERKNYLNEAKTQIIQDNQTKLDLGQSEARETLKLVHDQQERIKEMQAGYREAGLRASGQFYQADLEKIKESLRQQNAAIDEALAERMAMIQKDLRQGIIDPSTAAALTTQANILAGQQRGAAAGKSDQDAAGAGRAEDERRQQFEQRLNDIRLQGFNAILGQMGQQVEFERQSLSIAQDYAAKRREIADMMKEATDQQRQQLQLEIQELTAEEKIAEQAHIQQALKDAGAAPLKDAAAAGNRIAELMLKYQDIQQEFQQRSKELSATINDSSATTQQRQLAKSMLANLPDEEQRAKHRAAAQSMPFVNPNAPTEFVTTAGGQGVRGYAQMANEKAYLKYRQPFALTGDEISNFQNANKTDHGGGDVQSQILTEIRKLVAIFTANQTGNAASGNAPKTRGIFD